MKTSEMTKIVLDWAVAQCKGRTWEAVESFISYHDDGEMNYSTKWAQGGPIIEREGIEFWTYSANQDEHGNFTAIKTAKHPSSTQHYSGPTPLIAAMRCFVASKLGDEVEIPKELA
jgi:hypothetical protein